MNSEAVNPDEVENVIDMYNCRDLLPFVSRLFYLDAVREALGTIPAYFTVLTYEEIRGLVIVCDEKGKRSVAEMRNARNSSNNSFPGQPNIATNKPGIKAQTGIGLDRALIEQG